MTKLSALLDRNEQFSRTYTPRTLGIPTEQVVIVTCLDHRVDPAVVLGLQLGDAPVIRNVGGRVTQAVIDDIAYLAFLAERLFGEKGNTATLFEVAISTTPSAEPASSATPPSGIRLRRRPASLSLRSKHPPSSTRTLRSEKTSSACLPHRRYPEGECFRPCLRHRHRTRHHHR